MTDWEHQAGMVLSAPISLVLRQCLRAWLHCGLEVENPSAENLSLSQNIVPLVTLSEP